MLYYKLDGYDVYSQEGYCLRRINSTSHTLIFNFLLKFRKCMCIEKILQLYTIFLILKLSNLQNFLNHLIIPNDYEDSPKMYLYPLFFFPNSLFLGVFHQCLKQLCTPAR